MIVDSSALIAILLNEADAPAFAAALRESSDAIMAAPTLVETTIVAESRLRAGGAARLDELIAEAEIAIVPFTAEHARHAREGWRRFGKGRHPAALNLGDCFAYALAKARGEALLFKGDDFSRTDVLPALPPHG